VSLTEVSHVCRWKVFPVFCKLDLKFFRNYRYTISSPFMSMLLNLKELICHP